MKTRPAPKTKRQSTALRETAPVFGLNADTVNLRFAKAHLSALVDRAEDGAEILLTRDGKPAARLVPFQIKRERKLFIPDWEHLNSMPMFTDGPDATALIRADRDSRG
jgi:prevent-host-death family protein